MIEYWFIMWTKSYIDDKEYIYQNKAKNPRVVKPTIWAGESALGCSLESWAVPLVNVSAQAQLSWLLVKTIFLTLPIIVLHGEGHILCRWISTVSPVHYAFGTGCHWWLIGAVRKVNEFGVYGTNLGYYSTDGANPGFASSSPAVGSWFVVV